MSLGHGASIVRSGLILNLDAANPKSYLGTGTAWTDISNSNHSMTLVNSPVYSNGALVFDGLNDHTFANGTPNDFAWTPNGVVGMSSMTIEMWVQSSDTAGRFYTKPWNGGGQYNIWIDPVFFWLSTASGSSQLNFGRSISNGQWTQVVVWADSVNMGYYFNGGEYSGSQVHALTGDIPSSGNGSIVLGLMTLYPYGEGWGGLTGHAIAGSLSSCRVYNRVLSTTEVQNNFEATRGRYRI